MFPGYHKLFNAIALDRVIQPVDTPNYHLGIFPYEMLQNVEHGRAARTMPNVGREAVTGGILIGQTYQGVGGWGSLVPQVDPSEFPYYGEYLGGV